MDSGTLWNHQLIRYAGYETEQGIIGDPASVELTKAAMSLGWQGAGSPYDVLPLIIQAQGQAPEWVRICARRRDCGSDY